MSEHDIHVSICEIEIKEEKVEILLKTFLDDLQLAVGLTPGEEVPEDYSSADQMIHEYLAQTMVLKIGATTVQPVIEDISASTDAVWITLVSDLQSTEQYNVSFSNSFLTELYSDQTNIVNIKMDGEKKTYSLNRKKTDIIYEINK